MVLPTCGSYVSQLCVLGTLYCRFLASVSQSVKWEEPQALPVFQMWQGSVDNFGIERLLLIGWLSAWSRAGGGSIFFLRESFLGSDAIHRKPRALPARPSV